MGRRLVCFADGTSLLSCALFFTTHEKIATTVVLCAIPFVLFHFSYRYSPDGSAKRTQLNTPSATKLHPVCFISILQCFLTMWKYMGSFVTGQHWQIIYFRSVSEQIYNSSSTFGRYEKNKPDLHLETKSDFHFLYLATIFRPHVHAINLCRCTSCISIGSYARMFRSYFWKNLCVQDGFSRWNTQYVNGHVD